MAIEPVSYGDRIQQTTSLRRIEAGAVESAPDPANLTVDAPSGFAALSPFAADARRVNDLAAAAKAAAVGLVTQPVEVAPTEELTTTVEQVEPVEALDLDTPSRPDLGAEAYRSNAEERADPFSATSADRTLSKVA